MKMLVEVILIELSKLKVEFANNGRFDLVFVFKENKSLFKYSGSRGPPPINLVQILIGGNK